MTPDPNRPGSSLTYASVCSGIEAPGVATLPLGWRPLWFAEVAKFPSAVLAHHYPDIPNHGDFTALITNPPASPDVLIGGTPCQSFSVAGLRGGLTDHRGNLALAFMALVDVLRPRWLLWENVPGVLSSNGGRDFGSILGALGKLGYGFAYRILDAQYCGLAQRRKRVFLVGYSGDWRRPAAALFEPESVRRDSPPRRGSGSGVTGAIGTGASGGGGWRVGADEAAAGHVLPVGIRDSDGETARSLNGHPTWMDLDTETFVASIQDARPRSKGQNGAGISTDGVSYTLDAANTQAVAYNVHGANANAKERHAYEAGVSRCIDQTGGWAPSQGGTCVAHTLRGNGHDASEDGTGRGTPLVVAPLAFTMKDYGADAGLLSPTLRAGGHTGSHANGGVFPGVASPTMGVRRLSCTEMERLQGFSDGYTAIPYRGKPADRCPDGPRAKALGNSMATPVIRWICSRIELVDSLPPPTPETP